MQNRENSLQKYHRLSNYLSVAMLYLKDNYFLSEKLKSEHIKNRILGHWGTVPGLNLIYGGLNILIKDKIEKEVAENLHNQDETESSPINSVMYIAGPGHGAPAILSGIFLDGSLAEFYSKAYRNKNGWEFTIKQFSWPKGFPSHTYPGLPGQIHEGGELGYSLGTAFGTVFDNPDLLTVAVIGDGESETGPLAAAWHSNKFLNHKRDGVVLPILHLNGYKISGPTIPSTMTDEELGKYFEGLGYIPHIVDQYAWGDEIYKFFLEKLEEIYSQIKEYKVNGGKLPVLILKTKKGWTGPEESANGDKKIEDNNLSHGIPIEHPKKDEKELELIEKWLKSYKIEELFQNYNELIKDEGGLELKFDEEIKDTLPTAGFRIGENKYASGNPERIELKLPNLEDHAFKINKRGHRPDSRMEEFAQYHRDIFDLNEENDNFRIFSPDESESNKMQALYQETERVLNRELRPWDDNYSKDGRIMELLSEHVLQEWYEGYLKTGRHGILVSYEAFLPIITSQIEQYLKYLKQCEDFVWRKPISSMNFVATSTGWRQDHNGFSHQNPGLIHTLISRQSDNVSIYFPADVNILLTTLDDSYKRTNAINLIVAGKRDIPQWLTLEEAKMHVKQGISEWSWAGKNSHEADVVLVSAGDYQTMETLAAAQILKNEVPELNFKYINVNEITRLGLGDENNPTITADDYERLFTKDKPVIFNFHGYPESIKQITWGSIIANRTLMLGYTEHGSTTTPFDMQVVNKTSRYHICMYAVLNAANYNQAVAARKEELIKRWSGILSYHHDYIVQNGDDMPEVKDFEFDF